MLVHYTEHMAHETVPGPSRRQQADARAVEILMNFVYRANVKLMTVHAS